MVRRKQPQPERWVQQSDGDDAQGSPHQQAKAGPPRGEVGPPHGLHGSAAGRLAQLHRLAEQRMRDAEAEMERQQQRRRQKQKQRRTQQVAQAQLEQHACIANTPQSGSSQHLWFSQLLFFAAEEPAMLDLDPCEIHVQSLEGGRLELSCLPPGCLHPVHVSTPALRTAHATSPPSLTPARSHPSPRHSHP